jgi:lipoate-protein ligase A
MASWGFEEEDQVYGQRLAEIAKKHSRGAFLHIRRPIGGRDIFHIGGDVERCR